jgi:hypothetical protein
MKRPEFGIALIERPLLRALEALWEGPLRPDYLPAIESAIRAFLTASTLTASRYGSTLGDSEAVHPSRPDAEYEEPFDDQLLDYEFTYPREPHPFIDLGRTESEFLSKLVLAKLAPSACVALPRWIGSFGEAIAYLDAWYEGCPRDECEAAAKTSEREHLHPFERTPEYALYALSITHNAVSHAKYLVGCHRAGLIVYGHSPIAQICSEHLFSKWPDYLFKTLDEEYRQATEELRGPGLGVALPLLTTLLLSRAPSRSRIPEALRDIREEYEPDRDRLWTMLGEMWEAPTFKRQIGVLRTLEGAATSLFKTSFPERTDALSVALTAASLIKGDAVSPLRKLHDWNQPRARVGAVSFAQKLASDLRGRLLNQREIMRRHFTDAEFREFGSLP